MTLPRITILEALLMHLQANVPMRTDEPTKQLFKVRHERFRESAREEWPCVAIRYLGDDASGVATGSDDSQGLSLAETAMELRVELVVDTEVAPERDIDTAGDPDLGEDPTGMGAASKILEICLDSLFTPGREPNTLGGTVWDIRYDGTGDNDDLAAPDNVRLAERLTLVYRARAEAPHKLLLGE